MKLFLIGFMGAGKTAVGARLAARMGMEFVDLDAVIEARLDMRVARVFETRGEAYFRCLEHECLGELCADDRDLVVATGGGTPVSEQNRNLIRSSGLSVWLDPSFDVILARVDQGESDARPLFESASQARALFDERRPAYAEADITLSLGVLESPGDTAARIAEAIADHPACAQFVEDAGQQ